MKKELQYFDKRILIPDDVRSTIIKRIVFRIISFLVLEALLIFVAYFFSKGSGINATEITYCIAVIAPFAITRIPFCFFDKTYIGTIRRVDVETVAKTETAMKLFNKNVITVFIETQDGGMEVRKANEGKIKNSGIVGEYKEGDIAIHLYGTDFIVPLSHNVSKALNKKCFICGQTSPNEAEKCYHCGHTLLKNLGE
jgi:hypothetical protein